jgi:cyclophilin family peptidyl-prolyl cis-trans isomerase
MPTQKRERKKAGRQARQQAAMAARRQQSRRRQLIATLIVIAIISLILTATGVFNSSSSKKATVSAAGCPKADGSSPHTTSFTAAPPMCIDSSKTYTATMKTSQGTITLALDAKAAPKTVNNFVVLARYHFYDGLIFHRVVPDFVLQGGDPQGNGQGGPGYKFADELPKAGAYKTGSLAMANSGPNTNGSQFFILVSDNGGKQLQPLYSLFGQVSGGMDTVSKIAALGVPGSSDGAPKERVTIDSLAIAES